MWRDDDSAMDFALDTSASGQLAQQLELRKMAREATLKGMANSKLRRLLAHIKESQSTEIRAGGSVTFRI